MASTIRLAAVVLSYNTLTQNQFSRVPRDRELGQYDGDLNRYSAACLG
jgi:hypothetical protein